MPGNRFELDQQLSDEIVIALDALLAVVQLVGGVSTKPLGWVASTDQVVRFVVRFVVQLVVRSVRRVAHFPPPMFPRRSRSTKHKPRARQGPASPQREPGHRWGLRRWVTQLATWAGRRKRAGLHACQSAGHHPAAQRARHPGLIAVDPVPQQQRRALRAAVAARPVAQRCDRHTEARRKLGRCEATRPRTAATSTGAGRLSFNPPVRPSHGR